MSHKDDALQEIVLLARRNNIAVADIASALTDAPSQAAKESSGVLSKLFGYIGGILVFTGIGVFISMYWDDFGSAARVAVTLGTGFTVFLMGIVSLYDKKYERAATPLFLISSLLQPGGIFVMLDEYSSGGNWHHAVLYMAAIMIIQQGATFRAKRRTTLAFTSVVFGCIFFATLFDLWEIDENLIGAVIGTSLLCIAYAANNSRHAAISPFWYFVGSGILLSSVFDAVEHTSFELSFLGLTAFMIYLSVTARSRTLLLVSTLAMICYIGYFSAEHFADTLGWPLTLVIGGLVLIGISSAAVRINNKYIKQQG
ncbi:MAG: DUF2157 domain-containing protein [Pseudomonadota bacterium]